MPVGNSSRHYKSIEKHSAVQETGTKMQLNCELGIINYELFHGICWRTQFQG